MVTELAGDEGSDNPAAWGLDLRDAGPEFVRLIGALRDLQDAVTAAAPPPEAMGRVADQLISAAGELAPYAVGETEQYAGHQRGLPGRGQALSPPVFFDEKSAGRVAGRVTISRFYLGGGGAAHGGVAALIWDEVLGQLANIDGPRSRTAYLHVNYRAVTPIGLELTFDATVDRVDGRKRFLSGRMYSGGVLVTDAEGLFIDLRLDQA